MKVLVTGAGGFIGSRIAKLMLDKGAEVIGWDIRESEINGVKVYYKDMTDFDSVKAGLLEINPDTIIHCAGSANVPKSVQMPNMDFEGNVRVTHHLLFAMYQVGLMNCNMIFLSSAGVYGNPVQLPITEKTPRNPLSPYALHKAMCEDICEYFVKNYGLNIKVARIFSAYGVGIRKQIFWDMHQKYLKTGELAMFGTGDESRDYINIEDVVKAIYILAMAPKTDDIIYNVANGEETTIRQATECFADCYGIERDKISFIGTRREGEPVNWKADISKIQALGYEKSIDMADGMHAYIEWVRGL